MGGGGGAATSYFVGIRATGAILFLPSHQTTNRSASNERQIKLDTWEEHQTSICA